MHLTCKSYCPKHFKNFTATVLTVMLSACKSPLKLWVSEWAVLVSLVLSAWREVLSSEFQGKNELSGRVTHISTDTDTCPVWDHPTLLNPPLSPPTAPPQLLSAVHCPTLLNEFPSSFLLRSTTHDPSTHYTTNITTLYFPFKGTKL